MAEPFVECQELRMVDHNKLFAYMPINIPYLFSLRIVYNIFL